MLHAPDFLGYESAIAHGRATTRSSSRTALELKKIGNEVMTVVGGREVHPINVRVGGFYRVPRKRELAPLVDELERAREIALETVRCDGRLRLPRLRAATTSSSRSPSRASTRSTAAASSRTAGSTSTSPSTTSTSSRSTSPGRTRSTRGSASAAPTSSGRSRASRSRSTGSRRSRARPRRGAGSRPSERNPFRSIVVRAVELVYAADEALRLIAEYEEPDAPAVAVEPRAGVGHGCTEAPRGILYHRYELDDGRARSSTPRSCRRPRRTSGRSRRTCAASSSGRSTCPTTS